MTETPSARDRRAFAFSDLLPPRAPVAAGSALRPHGPVQAVVLGVLLALTLGYAAYWCYGHRAILVDVDRQNDDARQHLFHYHAYRGDGALAGDPVAQAARAYSPPAVRAIYRVLVPVTGLFTASKIVQGATWGIVLVGAWVLLRAERGGWAAACLFLFFMLHTPEITNRTVGGLPRAFAYPLLGLWLAGAVAANERARWAAAIVSGAVYPFAMLLILGGEGFLRLTQGVDLRQRGARATWLRYGVMVALCFAAVLPYQIEKGAEADPPTYAQAAADPAFGQQGRTKQLPFPDPVVGMTHAAMEVFYADKNDPPRFTSRPPFLENNRWAALGLILSLGTVAVLVASRRAPLPAAGIAMLLATLVLYVAARTLAFKLYIPSRYYEYGMPVAVIGLLVGGFGLIGHLVADGERGKLVRWAAAVGVLGATFAMAGTGVIPDNGIRLDRGNDAALYDFAETLPLEARILSHPHDGNDLPYWAARATVAARETLLPWAYPTWPEQVKRGGDTLRAMYATRREDLLRHVTDYGVTHILIHKGRYREDFAQHARLFEPLDRVVEEALAGVSLTDLVLADVPPEAVIYEDDRWRLLDANRLAAAWGSNQR